MDDTDFYLQVPSLFNITQIFWSSEDRVKARFYSVESRQNKPKANHRNLLSTEHTENTEKIKVKETLWGRCSSAFSSLIYLLWYALGLYCQERIIKKNYAKSKIKISIIKLKNIKYRIKTAKTLAFRGWSCCIFVFQAEDDFKNKKETFKPKIKQISQQLKCCLCLQNQQISMLSGPDRRPTISRSLLVRFPLTSR